jgi:hypothetical protein
MGRGLSDLQQAAMRIASRNREAEGRTLDTPGGADAFYHEILAEHYGFEPTGPLRYPAHYGEHAGQRIAGGQKFSRQAIGARRYDAAKVALSRAVGRLEHRGLVQVRQAASSHWSGISLTEAGVLLAKQLTVNSSASGEPVTRTINGEGA